MPCWHLSTAVPQSLSAAPFSVLSPQDLHPLKNLPPWTVWRKTKTRDLWKGSAAHLSCAPSPAWRAGLLLQLCGEGMWRRCEEQWALQAALPKCQENFRRKCKLLWNAASWSESQLEGEEAPWKPREELQLKGGLGKQSWGVSAPRGPGEGASRAAEAADPQGDNSCHIPWWNHWGMPGECHNNRWEARMSWGCGNRWEGLCLRDGTEKGSVELPEPLSRTPLAVEKLSPAHF